MNGNEYYVPSMKEIEKVKGTNGYKVVSTFSGCGGSCLGYEMAGFDVLWANEFLPEAQQVYRDNHNGTFLNTKNIREVTAEEIMSQAGIQKGELDIFDGSPPCDSFSISGQRDKKWGKEKRYMNSRVVQRTDDLFFVYIKLLNGLQPKFFIAENVKGLAIGKARGYLKEILNQCEEAGYIVKAQIIDFSYLGVPQARERVIIIGARKDLNVEPPIIKPFEQQTTLGESLKGVKNKRKELEWSLLRKDTQIYKDTCKANIDDRKIQQYSNFYKNKKCFNRSRASFYQPCPTLTTSGGYQLVHPTEKRNFTISELKRICSFPDDFVFNCSFLLAVERMGMSVPPLGMYYLAKEIKELLDKIS